ncbi:5-methyltetrahydropteroyltriglutamate--homocysteine S-methyltransferase [Alkalihalobacillus sp. MEB130]|uniref:5-methyltetrahydropteroyltriglutamate-- homocysteine S-methyltransferase n=1 Tax=Alkalihalobacillus sp. MEB130 TaxID=2976704 RepID=UPI0028DF0370|nr:5-methyltetrahydropteroyltriglutamate--homocysteine S-methyltransferase [Alkalihalobacillus sp. MEB130]MDT8860065.1 5-methyltetrahydropteroyltriglutamate--homocysteine S-methyltransferase [Alkalihalobacillus sp. MEB130]
MNSLKTSNLGYSRIGENREWKKTLEAYWSHTITEETFLQQMKKYRLHHLQKQLEKDVDLIPVGEFSYYDHVLDTASMFGFVPKRFGHDGGTVPLATYFAMARGSQGTHACEMTKWFDTNYHYIVPEIENKKPVLLENRPLQAFLEAKNELNITGKPVILGPFTFLKLSKGYNTESFGSLLISFIPVYTQLLSELAQAGATLVQIDEPSLVTDITTDEMELVHDFYEEISKQVPELEILLQTYFEAVSHYKQVIDLPVKAIGLDFVSGYEENIQSIKKFGFPKDKILAVGVIDGRNIWKNRLQETNDLITQLSKYVPLTNQILQPSSSLLHVPVTVKGESKLHSIVKDALAFGDEKLDELRLLRDVLLHPSPTKQNVLERYDSTLKKLEQSTWRKKKEETILPSERTKPFQERYELQNKKWNLPLLPTTTIGSFPQTKDIRKARFQWRKGELANDTYEAHIKSNIEKWIRIQEELDIDVLVHGEFERNDMVEFFGEKLTGFAFSQNGWVQSYGSRCVKPPIIYGNVSFDQPITLKETLYAQSLTNRPVKGMLTGPVTILNWSFVRNDLTHKEVAFQIAEALLQEVQSLENSGITMIQVDEPALREGLPLKQKKHSYYLDWAVEAFKRSTSAVSDTTQIHTHMCYSDFNEIIDAIKALDADVISIETSRSHAELISAFETNVYDKGIGLGVYDIHSPRVPSEEEITSVLERALSVLPANLFWVNPDCGLKTRGEQETVAALSIMVQAAKKARQNIKQVSESL